jgi:hypothetical protein
VSGLRLDLGCGFSKAEGTIGVDKVAGPGVDHVVDFETDRLPFADGSVEYIYSSHCLEHLGDPFLLFGEISRVCQNGARLELWTPYAWESSAFVFGHRTFYNEEHYLHMCVRFWNLWMAWLGARWVLQEVVYVIEPATLMELYRQRIDLDFAVRYHKGVVWEFGVLIDVWRDFPGPEVPSRRSFSEKREAPRHPLPPIVHPAADVPADKLAEAIAWHAAPFKSSRTHVGPARAPHGLPLVGHLVRRVRAVAREEGLAQVARRTVTYAGTRIRRAAMNGQTVP